MLLDRGSLAATAAVGEERGGCVSRRGSAAAGARGGHKQHAYLKARWEEDSTFPKIRALRA